MMVTIAEQLGMMDREACPHCMEYSLEPGEIVMTERTRAELWAAIEAFGAEMYQAGQLDDDAPWLPGGASLARQRVRDLLGLTAAD